MSDSDDYDFAAEAEVEACVAAISQELPEGEDLLSRIFRNYSFRHINAALSLLQSDEPAIRRAATNLLSPDYSTYPLDPQVSLHLITVALGPLLGRLKDEVDPEAQALTIKAVADLIERIVSTDFTHEALHLVSSSSEVVRFALASHLYRLTQDLPGSPAFPVLLKLCSDSDADVRYYAFSSLVDTPDIDPSRIDAEAQRLEADEDEQIRQLASGWRSRQR